MEALEALHKIEVLLNLPTADNCPVEERFDLIKTVIKALSHKALFEHTQLSLILNDFQDYRDFITVDFSSFDEPDVAEEDWRLWNERYVNRPRVRYQRKEETNNENHND